MSVKFTDRPIPDPDLLLVCLKTLICCGKILELTQFLNLLSIGKLVIADWSGNLNKPSLTQTFSHQHWNDLPFETKGCNQVWFGIVLYIDMGLHNYVPIASGMIEPQAHWPCTMVVLWKTYHRCLVAKCLFKAEVASMGDKSLEVGVGQQVLRKYSEIICRRSCKNIFPNTFWNLWAPVGVGNSWGAHWEAFLVTKNLNVLVCFVKVATMLMLMMPIPGRVSVSHLKRTFSFSRPKASRSAASLSWGTWCQVSMRANQ